MWPSPQKTADLVTFTEEIYDEQLHSLCIGHFMNLRKLSLENCTRFLFLR